eukprot:3552595-Pyramimonas_sp.AAC.1
MPKDSMAHGVVHQMACDAAPLEVKSAEVLPVRIESNLLRVIWPNPELMSKPAMGVHRAGAPAS